MAEFEKEIIYSPTSGKGAPYSPAVAAGPLVFTSGQIGRNPRTGELPADFEAQARQAFENLRQTLSKGSVLPGDVVKVTCYLVDESHYEILNKLFAEAFPRSKPARTTVFVKGLPFGALIELEAVGVRPVAEEPQKGYLT